MAMVKQNVDLVVIEGMGRTLHTNLHAKMKCECLKVAVVKNRWLATRLGGEMYAVICKYERPTLAAPMKLKQEETREENNEEDSAEVPKTYCQCSSMQQNLTEDEKILHDRRLRELAENPSGDSVVSKDENGQIAEENSSNT